MTTHIQLVIDAEKDILFYKELNRKALYSNSKSEIEKENEELKKLIKEEKATMPI